MANRSSKANISGRGKEPMGRGIDVLFGEAGVTPPPRARRAEPATSVVAPPAFPTRGTEEVLDEMLSVEALAGQLDEAPGAPSAPIRRRPSGARRDSGTREDIFVPAPEPAAEEAAMAVNEEELAPEVSYPKASPSTDYKPPTRSPLPPAVAEPSIVGPPPEAKAASGRPVSLRIGGIVMDVPSEDLASLVPPGPGERVTPEIEITPREYAQDEQERILAQLTLHRRDELMREIDVLYERTSTRLAPHQEHSGTALKLLHQSRTILLERPYAFADAELRMQAAKTLLNRTENSRRVSNRNWPWLFAYEIVWALLLLVGLIFEGVLGAWVGRLEPAVVTTMQGIFPAWGTMMVGGIGGVVCALWSMWWHISDQQDYDPQYNLWYVVQPFQGMVLGIIVYLIIAAGFLALQTDISSPEAGRAAKYFPWLVAAIAGIRQTYVYELLDRVIRVISPRGGEGGQ